VTENMSYTCYYRMMGCHS